MSVIIPDCTSCKHINFKKKINGQLCCTAFPNGIPKEYFWGKINVRELSECADSVHFEEEVLNLMAEKKKEHYNMRESDYNFEKAQKLYGDKTVEGLELEIKKFEESFKKNHRG